jgi:type VI secretion system protein ImpB
MLYWLLFNQSGEVMRNLSVAPRERVNIVYQSKTNMREEVELPLKLLVLGAYTSDVNEQALEVRRPINIDKDNFDDVLAAHHVVLNITVPCRLNKKEEGHELTVQLALRALRDFEPDRIVEQVPELKKIVLLRQALLALKGPLGNIPAFRKKLQSIVSDKTTLLRLYQELGIVYQEEN